MKHTELPWLAIKDKDLIYIDAEVFNVCDLYHMNQSGIHQKENAEANAAFIVKAVNNHYQLLETLEKVGDTLAYIVNHADIGIIYEEAKLATEKAREAIKQAEDS